MKRISVLMIAMLLLISSLTMAQEQTITNLKVETATEAKEIVGLDITDPNVILINGNQRGGSRPNIEHEWSDGDYSWDGNTTVQGGILYANKYWSDFSSGDMGVENVSADSLTLKIYKRGFLFDSVVITLSIPAYTTKYYNLTGFDSSDDYYVFFTSTGLVDTAGYVSK